MHFLTQSPKLQSEFLQFLEQKLLDLEEQLSATGKEKDELRAALSQTQQELNESNHALEALRKPEEASGAAVALPNVHQESLLESLRSELRQASEDHLTERVHRTKAESSLSETVSELEHLTTELERNRGLVGEMQEQQQRAHTAHLREKEELQTQVVQLREQLKTVEASCAKANAEHDQNIAAYDKAISAEKQAQQKLADTQTQLDATTKDLSAVMLRLSEQMKLVEKGDISRLKLREFQDKMGSLPVPPGPGQVDFKSLKPITVPTSELQKRITNLTLRKVMYYRIHESNSVMWFPSSCHGLLVCPQSSYYSGGRGEKWGDYPHWLLSLLDNKNGVEVFHKHLSQDYYMGTYKVVQGPIDIRLPDLASVPFVGKDLEFLESQLAKATAGATPEKSPVALTLPEMYTKGILAVQLLGLQRIGFNEKVDEEVHRTGMPPPPPKVFPPNPLATPPPSQERDGAKASASLAPEVPKAPAGSRGSETRARSKETPVKSNEPPVKSKETPVKSKETPAKTKGMPPQSSQMQKKAEEAPVKAKEPPATSKETLTASTRFPSLPLELRGMLLKATEAPVKAKESPVKAKESPVKAKETPVKVKETPAQPIETPVKAKVPPATSKNTLSTAPKRSPPIPQAVKAKETPVKAKETPARPKATPAPVKSKAAPTKEKEAPVKAKETPVKAGVTLAKARETPVKAKETQVKAREPPVKAKETPAKKGSVVIDVPAVAVLEEEADDSEEMDISDCRDEEEEEGGDDGDESDEGGEGDESGEEGDSDEEEEEEGEGGEESDEGSDEDGSGNEGEGVDEAEGSEAGEVGRAAKDTNVKVARGKGGAEEKWKRKLPEVSPPSERSMRPRKRVKFA